MQNLPTFFSDLLNFIDVIVLGVIPTALIWGVEWWDLRRGRPGNRGMAKGFTKLLVGFSVLAAAFLAWDKQYTRAENERKRAENLSAPKLEIELLYAGLGIDQDAKAPVVLMAARIDNVGGASSNCRSFRAEVHAAERRLFSIRDVWFPPDGVQLATPTSPRQIHYGIEVDLSHMTRVMPAIQPNQIVVGYLVFMLRKTASLDAANGVIERIPVNATATLVCLDMRGNEIPSSRQISNDESYLLAVPGLTPLRIVEDTDSEQSGP